MKERGRRRLGDGLDDGVCATEAEVEELPGGVEAVAGFGIGDVALHDVDEETDYKAAVAGLLADDVGEGFGIFIVWGSVANICSTLPGVGGWGQRGVDGEGGVKCGRRGAVRAATANRGLRFLGFARDDRGGAMVE